MLAGSAGVRWLIESITRTDLARFFVWAGDGFARDALFGFPHTIIKYPFTERTRSIRVVVGTPLSTWHCHRG